MSESNFDVSQVEQIPTDHPTADCATCQDVLRPSDATGVSRTWPIVNMPGLDPWLRKIVTDDEEE